MPRSVFYREKIGPGAWVQAVGTPPFDITGLTNGTVYEVDDGNGIVEYTPAAADVTAPVLSSPTGTATGQTTADLSVSTDEGNGTLYWVVTQSATGPSAAQVKAGQDHTGSAADANGNQAVTGTGTQNANATDLTAATAYFAHYMHEDAATNQSTVATSAEFTTDAASAVAITFLDSDFSTSDLTEYTFSAMSVGDSASGEITIVEIAQGSSAITGVTVGGTAATQRVALQQDGYGVFIYTVSLSAGATADVVVTNSPAAIRCAVTTYKMTGAASAVPSDTAIVQNTEPASTTLDIAANGAAIGVVYCNVNSTGTYTWTGLDTEDLDIDTEGTRRFSTAHENSVAGETGRTITADHSGNPAGTHMALAAWSPS
jgi:hypothetical protein